MVVLPGQIQVDGGTQNWSIGRFAPAGEENNDMKNAGINRWMMTVHTMRFSIAVTFLFCVIAHVAHAESLKVVLRYDDYSSYENGDSRIHVEQTLFDIVRSVGGNLLVGLIPFPGNDYPDSTSGLYDLALDLSQKKRNLLKKYALEGVVTVGLHGFSHTNNNQTDVNSEFGGLPEAQQAFLLRTAKRALESEIGINVKIFIPSFNQYDNSTLNALATTGFELISAGASGGPVNPDLPLRYLPGGVYPDALNKLVKSAVMRGNTDGLIVSTIHPYDIKEIGEGLPTFRKGGQVSIETMRQDLQLLHDEDIVQITSVQELMENGEDLSAARVQSNHRLASSMVSKYGLIPDVFNLYPLRGLYYKRTAADRMYYYQIIAAIGFYTSCFFISGIIIFLINMAVTLRKFATIASFAISLTGILLIGVRSFFSGFFITSAVGLTICLGFLAGTGLYLLRLRAKYSRLKEAAVHSNY